MSAHAWQTYQSTGEQRFDLSLFTLIQVTVWRRNISHVPTQCERMFRCRHLDAEESTPWPGPRSISTRHPRNTHATHCTLCISWLAVWWNESRCAPQSLSLPRDASFKNVFSTACMPCDHTTVHYVSQTNTQLVHCMLCSLTIGLSSFRTLHTSCCKCLHLTLLESARNLRAETAQKGCQSLHQSSRDPVIFVQDSFPKLS